MSLADMSPGLRPGEPRRVIRVFFDYAHWPLWENSTAWRDSPYTMGPSDYGLSQELTRLLTEWNTLWEEHFRFDTGWDAPETEAAFHEERVRIVAMLGVEVADWADVRDESPTT